MLSSQSWVAGFQPGRKLFGYDRKATDEFLAHTGEVLTRTGQRLAQLEAELVEQREKARSLTETLLAAARAGEAIKQDARQEADTIRAEGRALEEFVATRRSQFSAFLRETLEKLETLPGEGEAAERVDQAWEEEPQAPPSQLETPPAAETSPDDGGAGPDDSILERLKPYRVDSRGDHSASS
jgi:DivIVA protein